MRIKVIFTGGTISSVANENGINVAENSSAQKLLIENFLAQNEDMHVEFDVTQPLNILSENISISHWNILLKTLREIDFCDYDGIIIAHGTDTLAFTTNLLSIMLAGIEIPVVMVSSDYILTDERANGNDNFKNAVIFIKNSGLKGVYAIYRDNENKHKIYLGSRLKQCSSLKNEYSSTAKIDFGEVINGEIILNSSKHNPTKSQINNSKMELLMNKIQEIKPCVAQIYPYTGLNYDMYSFPKSIKAVVNFLYHGSTACVLSDEDYCTSLTEFAKLEQNKGIDFYASPFERDRSDLYQSTNELFKANIKPIYNISEEMTYIKLLIAYSTDNQALRKYILDTNIFFEEV